MAWAGIALTVVSTALSAYNSYEQGKYEQEAAERSAEISELNAKTAAIETASNEDVARKQLRQRLSRQLVAQGEAGISGNGFATTSYLQSVKSGWQDVLNLRYKGQSEVANYRNKAAISRFQGQSAYNAGRADSWVTGIKGAASALSQGYDAGYFATKGK